MKKTLIAAAVAASVIAPISAQAVNSAADDAGEALIYPYYNVNEGNQSFIAVVNTTNHAKVLKVRFREAVESEDVFDFQLWLSAHDHWTAVISQINGQVRVSTADLSCTVPQVINNTTAVFNPTRVPLIYTGNVLDRISEGHAEVIEMAALGHHNVVGIGELVNAVTHVNGVPADCNGPINFNNQGRVVRIEGTAVNNGWGASFNQPLGGVYGISAIFNPTDGTYFTYTAEALEQFAAQPIFYPQTEALYRPGPDHTADLFLGSVEVLEFDLPDLSTPDSIEGQLGPQTIVGQAFNSANGFLPLDLDLVTRGTYITNGILVTDNLGLNPLLDPPIDPLLRSNAARKKRDAVTTALMGVRIINDYLTGVEYDTDWVFTFPGRYLYRLPPNSLTTYPMDNPFDSVVDRTTGRGCEQFGSNILYGREEEQLIGSNIGFSPGDAPDIFALCYEVNVIAVNDSTAFGTPTSALGSIAVRADATSSQVFGWADFGLQNHALRDDFGGIGDDLTNFIHLGMPVVGFAAIVERKGDVDRGGAFMHKITRGVAINVGGVIEPEPEPEPGLPPINL